MGGKITPDHEGFVFSESSTKKERRYMETISIIRTTKKIINR